MYSISDREFKYISGELYKYAKINLTLKKRSLVISRLSKRIRKLNLSGFEEYVDYLKNDDPDRIEFYRMVDALSTNYSLFFRESYHFDYMVESILPAYEHKSMNIWSAASSTGQEIYSILITLLEYEKQTGRHLSYRLLASDISTDVLKYAARGIYPKKDTDKIDPKMLSEYFLKGRDTKTNLVKVKKDLIRKITFFRLNLSDKTYQLPKMDIIFLRNVIIYFDRQTKTELIERLYDYLNPGGHLFLGHSESLAGISDKFYPVGKTIYRRVGDD